MSDAKAPRASQTIAMSGARSIEVRRARRFLVCERRQALLTGVLGAARTGDLYHTLRTITSLSGILSEGAAGIWRLDRGVSAFCIEGPQALRIYGEGRELAIHRQRLVQWPPLKTHLVRRLDRYTGMETGPTSYCGTPLWVEGQLWGAMEVFSGAKIQLNPADAKLLEAIRELIQKITWKPKDMDVKDPFWMGPHMMEGFG